MEPGEREHMPEPASMPDAAWTMRNWRGAHEYAAMAAVFAASAAADQLDGAITAEVMAASNRPTDHFEPSRDILLAEADGLIVAVLRCGAVVDADGAAAGRIVGTVHPDWRERGIGTRLLRAGEHILRERFAALFALAADFVVWSDDAVSTARELFVSEDYRPVRYTATMLHSLEHGAGAARMPDGLELRPVAPEHFPAIWRAQLEAFADHWGFHLQDWDYETWLHMPGFDPDMWQVAWDGDEVAGMVLGWIESRGKSGLRATARIHRQHLSTQAVARPRIGDRVD